ncbi:MAG: pilus assembly protein [Acidobacteria bacterium]|nr:pilus assembly protein [Acidobacteriota bacterium]
MEHMIGTVSRRRARSRGHSVVEVAVLGPWIFLLIAGVLDMGYYAYAMIATQNAARAAAEYTSRSTATAGNSDAACQYALIGLHDMPNVRSLSSCGAEPLTVSAAQVTGADGSLASSVSVTYQTPMLVPIPGLMGQLNITRTVQMRIL